MTSQTNPSSLAGSLAAATGDNAEVLAMEQERIRAVIELDMPAIDAMMADDLVHIHSNGMVHDKAALLNHIETKRAFRAIDRGPLAVRVAGDFAIMHGPITNHMVADGKPRLMEGVVTQILRREHGNWRFISFQLTLNS